MRPSDARQPGAQDHAHRRADVFRRWLAIACFSVLLFLNLALSGYQFAYFPIRGLMAAGLLVILFVLYFEIAADVMRKNVPILALAAGLALLGIFVSAINRAPMEAIVETVTEVHLQTAITLMVATILARLCGAKWAIIAIVALIGASGAVAMLQLLDVEFAWSAREVLGNMQSQALSTFQPWIVKRPMGLSFSPIQLSTQLCLAFAAYAAWREIDRRSSTTDRPAADPAIIAALMLFLAVCVATGTRSPILGGVIFFAVYTATRRGSWLPIFLMFGAGVLYFAWPSLMAMFQTAQPRIVRVDDSSAAGHLTLAYYGLLLFLDNPLGYGFAFKPFNHWTDYWHELYLWPSPGGAQSKELHDYVLNMLTMYGIGLLLFVPLVVKLLRRARGSLIFFIPYIVQIMFHNAGPFWSDAIIWFVIAALAVAVPAPVSVATAVRVQGRGARAAPTFTSQDVTQGTGLAARSPRFGSLAANSRQMRGSRFAAARAARAARGRPGA